MRQWFGNAHRSRMIRSSTCVPKSFSYTRPEQDPHVASIYNRDALEQLEGYTPDTTYCGRLATVARPSPIDETSAASSSSNHSTTSTRRYLVEDDTLLGRMCALGNAIEYDLKRIRFDLFDRRQMRVVSRATNDPHRNNPLVSNGSAALVMKPVIALVHLVRRLRNSSSSSGGIFNSEESSLALAANAPERFRPYFNLHQLNYYFRMSFIPKRHIVWGTYVSAWNFISATVVAGVAIIAIPLHYIFASPVPLRDMRVPTASNNPAHTSPFERLAAAMASHPSRWVRAPYGIFRGARAVILYAFLGCIASPLIHISQALVNMPFGLRNALTQPHYTFDAADGVWIRHSVRNAKAIRGDMEELLQKIIAVGRREAYARKVVGEGKWKDHLHKLGISKGGASQADDPYEVLGVPRHATPQQIKASYQKLAKLYHPDVSASAGLTEKEKEEGRAKFDNVASAYKMLSNPETRRAYDRGGKKAVEMQQGAVLAGSSGDIMERVFGGAYFRETLCGMHFRSHWHMKFQFQCCVSITELEQLQSLQVRLVAIKLADILDVHASDTSIYPFAHLGSNPTASPSNKTTASNKQSVDSAKTPLGGGPPSSRKPIVKTQVKDHESDAGTNPVSSDKTSNPYLLAMLAPPTDSEFGFSFRSRVQRFVAKLGTACFGKELLYELGQSYITSAKAYLGVEGTSYYAPKRLQWTKNWSGTTRVVNQFKVHVAGKSKEELQQLAALEFFTMEWDNVCLDTHVQSRFASQLVIWSEDGDVAIEGAASSAAVYTTPTGVASNTLRYRRLRALWYLGLQMQAQGVCWDSSGRQNDKDLIEYFKRSAKMGMDTAPVF